ncbi:DUF7940 domain-containing protein [Pararhizobium qamdonense]|uniref:DUF7940 domain-containing protein n=1 Tax=Pararhizobium qamdonense TaxID=3031126 RepID=UPI0023E20191|nr:hypothetical protein [Pararhizobium qamdonense]
MKLRADWKKILKNAWTVRLFLFAAAMSGLEAVIPYLPAFLAINPIWIAILTPLTCMLGIYARLVAQKSISGDDHAD